MGRCTVRGAQAVTSKEDAFVHVAFFHKRRTGKLRHVVKQKKKKEPPSFNSSTRTIRRERDKQIAGRKKKQKQKSCTAPSTDKIRLREVAVYFFFVYVC